MTLRREPHLALRRQRHLARVQWAAALAAVGAMTAVTLLTLTADAPIIVPPSIALHNCGRFVAILGPRQLATVAITTLGLVAFGRALRTAIAIGRLTRRLGRVDSEPRVIGAHRVHIVDSARPFAFTAGLVRPRIYASAGALRCLQPDQLLAVIAHEDHHRRRRDPLRTAGRRLLGEVLFFIPSLRRLRAGHDAIAEIDADRSAAGRADGGRRALAGALLALAPAGPRSRGVSPARVDHLLTQPAQAIVALRDTTATVAVCSLLAGLVWVAFAGDLAGAHPLRICARTLALAAVSAVAVGFGWRTTLSRRAHAAPSLNASPLAR